MDECELTDGMKKFARILVIFGVVLILLGFAIGPGVPYQDPTPEMLAKEKSDDARAKWLLAAGGATVAAGVVIITVSILAGKRRKTK
jgi:hypothetical protein